MAAVDRLLAVDWDNHGDTFHNEWQTYRSRRDPILELSTSHEYEEPGEYTIVVKVIDILGNDTTKSSRHGAGSCPLEKRDLDPPRPACSTPVSPRRRACRQIRKAVAEWSDRKYKGATETTKLLLNHWFTTDHRTPAEDSSPTTLPAGGH